MALPPGTIVVANPGRHIGLFAVDPATGQQTTLAQGGLLVEPANVVVMADGRLLVADLAAFGTGGLIVVDPATGQQTKASSSELFLKPYGLALAADGQVVVVYVDRPHPFPAAVMRVNPANGDHRAVAIDFPFDMPWAVALDAVGNAIVTDPGQGFTGLRSRLIRVDIGVGGSFPSIRADISGVFTGVAVEPTGHLIVTDDDPSPGRQKLLRFHPTSGPPTVVSQGNKFRSLTAVAVEANGAILVADRPGAIFRVDPATGAQSTVSVGGSLRGRSASRD